MLTILASDGHVFSWSNRSMTMGGESTRLRHGALPEPAWPLALIFSHIESSLETDFSIAPATTSRIHLS